MGLKEVSVEDRELVRLVRAILAPIDGGHAPRRITFCAANRRCDASFVCAGAAKALASMNEISLCLVEGNPENGRLGHLCGIQSSAAPFIPGQNFKEQCQQVQNNLWLAQPEIFSPYYFGVTSAERVNQVIHDLGEAFDYVLVNAPGVEYISQAMLCSRSTDATILVLDDTTKQQIALSAKETLDTANVRILGSVFINRT